MKANYSDLYDVISFRNWKTGMELREELEGKGLRTGHMRGVMYVHLNQWEEQRLIRSRERPLTEEEKGLGKTRLAREYLRISEGRPRKIFEREERLGSDLQTAPV